MAFEAGCEDYCEREVDEVEWQGGRVYLGARRNDPPRGQQPERRPRTCIGAKVATAACSAVSTQPMATPAAMNQGGQGEDAGWAGLLRSATGRLARSWGWPCR